MPKKAKYLGNITTGVFNKKFFGFLSGFLGLVCIGLISVFIAGYYKTETSNSKNLEAKAPIGQVKIDNSKNSSLIGKAFQQASSTR